MDVLVVESPAKAKTIGKYLGPGYTVLASYGHVRDLPAKDGSVRPDEDFAMDWEVDAQSQKRLDAIAKAVSSGSKLYLATDPDREGEAISWHVRDVLKRKKALDGVDVKRVTFNAITKQSVLTAVAHPRELDQPLIDAYLARRALDYLVGFTLSPVLWRKLPGSRSAGRVQSVALRLICEREAEIEVFKTREYWTVDVLFGTAKQQTLKARLTHLDGRKLDRFDLDTQERAEQARREIERRAFSVLSVDRRQVKRNPPPPFITSTLQQEASRKLGLGAAVAMRIAQRLYEGVDIGGETVGLITYMRTDGVQLAPEAIGETRRLIESRYGADYVPEKPRVYTSKAKNAQEAHEAIRPTDLFRTPQDVAPYLDRDQLGLYELIWKRTVASQMESAVLDQVTVDIASGDKTVQLRATGSVIKFNGFLTLYDEGRDDKSDDDEASTILPDVVPDEALDRRDIIPEQHFTEPPPRYSEASLVKKLEELGIGRPSTYASIIEVLQRRSYVRLDRKRFVPEDRGRIVTSFLQTYFPRYVEYNFTAHLEEELDDISDGKIDWRQVLREFWTAFSAAVGETKELRVKEVLDRLDEELGPHFFPANDNGDGKSPRDCPSCANGRLGLKLGKFGAFIGCSNYPECRFTRKLGIVDAEADAASGANLEGPKILGIDPVSGKPVTLRNGPYGLYVQLGEPEGKEKPRRQSLLKGMTPDDVTLERALALLALPRELGAHPDDGEPILAGVGRFGPYVKHGTKYKTIPADESVLDIGMNRAVALLAEAKSAARGRAAVKPVRIVGNHPSDEAPVELYDGRYGPYVKHGGINATVPNSIDPPSLTLDQAVALLAERAAKGGGKPARGTKRQANGAAAANGNAAPKAAKAKKKAAPKRKAAAPKAAKGDAPPAPEPMAKGTVPTRDELLAFIRESATPVGKREIARAWGLKGDQRIALKEMLRDLRDSGDVAADRAKTFRDPGALADVTVLEIVRVDDDGHLIALPLRHDEAKDGPPPRIEVAQAATRSGPAPAVGDRVLANLKRRGKTSYEARVIRRLGSGPKKILGLYEEPDGRNGLGLVTPTDRKLRSSFDVRPADKNDAQPGDIVWVEATGGSLTRRARVLERIGAMSDPRTVSLIAIAANDIPVDFPAAAVAEAEHARAAPLGHRLDLRATPLVTIDGEDARDFDDAVFAEADPDHPGGWRLVVAIADVAWYVRPDKPLDNAAYRRGTSVYFPDRVVPMLPEALSNHWCSLVPGEDRPVLAVEMWIDGEGQLKRHRFHRAMMRSAARLTYNRVQRAVDGNPDAEIAPLMEQAIRPLYGAFRVLLEARQKRGALDLDLPERQVTLAPDGRIAEIGVRVRLDSHRLIEEFMVLANVAAAQALEQRHSPCLYRVHDQPDAAKLEALREFLGTLGLALAPGPRLRPADIERVLKAVEDKPVARLVNETVLRSQSQAVYSPDNLGHFGLALARYAHFTSPIRRYPDLIVHRALIAAFGLGEGGLPEADKGRFAEFGEHLSMCERRAVAAERAAMDRYVAAYMATHVGASFPGRVTSVTRFGLFASLDATGADGLIPIRSLGQEFFRHDEGRQVLVGERTGETYGLGDRLQLKLADADVATGGLLFEIVDVIERVDRSALPTGGRGFRQKQGKPRRPVAHRGQPQDKRSRRRN